MKLSMTFKAMWNNGTSCFIQPFHLRVITLDINPIETPNRSVPATGSYFKLIFSFIYKVLKIFWNTRTIHYCEMNGLRILLLKYRDIDIQFKLGEILCKSKIIMSRSFTHLIL